MMGWATKYIEALSRGEKIVFRPRGHSMSGKIENGQLVTIEPLHDQTIKVGKIVLCKVNGWTSRRNIFGIVTRIENH